MMDDGTGWPNKLMDMEFLQFAIDQHAIVSVTDVKGTIIHVNDNFCQISGYSRDELLGENHRILKSDEHSLEFYQDMWRTISRGETWHGEIRNEKKDGSCYWVKASIIPRVDAQGKPFQYIGIRTDITDRKQAELEAISYLDSKNKLHRFYLDNIDVGAFLIENATIMDVSSYGAQMLGYKQEELIGQSPTFVVSQRSKENVARRVKHGNEEAYESEGIRKNGSTFPMLVRGRELVYEGRNVRLTTLMDLSERKRAESELRKLSRAVEQSPAAIFISGTDGTIEYVNAKFSEYTGYSEEESIGQNPRLLSSGDTPPEVYSQLWETILAGDIWRGEIKDKRKDGSMIWASATIAPVKDDEGIISHYISSHEDISRRKEAELALQDALEKANIANKAKTEMLANMSHELRTPLNAIIGFSQTILGQIFGPLGNEKYLEYAADINSSGQHLLELINDILDMAAIEAGKTSFHETEISLKRAINSAVRLVTPRANAGNVSLSASIPSECGMIVVDERRLKQILLNLLSNAVKFTRPGGSVEIAVTFCDVDGISVVIKDTGIGMDEDGIRTAMTVFGQVDGGLNRKEEGSGLGLPLTQSLLEQHGGKLTISSEKDVGTTATVWFPPERIVGKT